MPVELTYIDHLRAEHRQLQREVREIQNSLRGAALARGQEVEFLRRLKDLRNELLRHFAEEEAGGCLEEAVSVCPSVASLADAVQQEHPELLARLERLIFRVSEAHEQLSEAADEFHLFAKDLLAHEAAENQVMERAFGVTVNGDEEE